MPLFTAVDMASLINTEKMVSDHVFSFATGKDCSTLKAREGRTYCAEYDRPQPYHPQEVYCYRSLGQVNCFDRPLVEANDKAVGSANESPLPALRGY